MKKIVMIICTLCSLLMLVGCVKPSGDTFDENMKVMRYSRDDTSGTRDGFFTAIGYEEAIKDNTKIPGATIATDNGNMIFYLKNDIYGIGYISLSSLETSTLKALNFEGVEPTIENVTNGSYKLSRNFNYITMKEEDCTPDEWMMIKAFMLFMSSKEGKSIIKAKDGILIDSVESSKTFSTLLEENKEISDFLNQDGEVIKIKFGGSTSVLKMSQALTSAFASYTKRFEAVHNHTGSGAAYKGTQGSNMNTVNGMHIGFLSRELKTDEVAAEGTSGLICKDGIVVCVNSKNTLISNITKETLKKIYESETITWSEIK